MNKLLAIIALGVIGLLYWEAGMQPCGSSGGTNKVHKINVVNEFGSWTVFCGSCQRAWRSIFRSENTAKESSQIENKPSIGELDVEEPIEKPKRSKHKRVGPRGKRR